MDSLLNSNTTDMCNGIYYKFTEKDTYENKIINMDEFNEEIDSLYSSTTTNTDSDCSNSDNDIDNDNLLHIILELEYANYNVKMLSQLMDYYALCKKNMRKYEMIQLIILFEIDPLNLKIVDKRRCLWNYLNELKKDKYFSKLIIW